MKYLSIVLFIAAVGASGYAVLHLIEHPRSMRMGDFYLPAIVLFVASGAAHLIWGPKRR